MFRKRFFTLFLFILSVFVQDSYGMKDDSSDESMEEKKSSTGLPKPNFSCFDIDPQKFDIEDNKTFINTVIENNTNNDGFSTPKRKSEALTSGLTPTISQLGISSSPLFGDMTPQRYKNHKNQSQILRLFIANFIEHEKECPDNSLFKLVNFLFQKKDGDVIAQNNKISGECINFIKNSFDNNFFNKLFTDIGGYIEHNKKNSDLIKSKQLENYIKLLSMVKEALKSEKTIRSLVLSLNSEKVSQEIRTKNKTIVDNFIKSYNECKDQQDESISVNDLYDSGKVIPVCQFLKEKQKELEQFLKTYDIRKEVFIFVMATLKKASHQLFQMFFAGHKNPQKPEPYTIKNNEIKKNEDWIFLNNLIDCFAMILTTELYRTQYWNLCPYLLGQYLLLNKSLKIKSQSTKRLKLDNHDGENNVNDKNNIVLEEDKKLPCFFETLFELKNSESQNETILNFIAQTPLYYLLCFDSESSELSEIISHIVCEKHSGYKNADKVKTSEVFETFIDRLLGVVKQNDVGEKVVKSLEFVFDQVIKNLGKMKINQELNNQTGNVFYSKFKPLICAAIKVGRFLKKDTQLLKSCIFVDIDHIQCVTFAPGKKVFGGGHLDLDTKTFDQDLKDQNQGFCLFKKVDLGIAQNGIKIVEWLITEEKNQDRCFTNKMSTLFPNAVKKENIHEYIETLYKAIVLGGDSCITILKTPQDQDVQLNDKSDINEKISQNNEEIDQDVSSSELVLCDCKENFVQGSQKMRVVLCIDYCYIDKDSPNKDDKENIIPMIKTMYPCGALYFTRDKEGNVYFEETLIETQGQLDNLCKGWKKYKRTEKNDICYTDGNVPEYEDLTLSLEKLKEAKVVDTSLKFKRGKDLKAAVEFVQNICLIEVFVDNK